jgi:septum formation protein
MNSTSPKLILASRSPRRRELLREAGYEFDVIPPSDAAEGDARPGESPLELVERLARDKAADVARGIDAGLILGCDTVAECGGQILGKPADRDDARRMLELLRGQEHRVYSGVCLWPRPDDRVVCEVATTTLRMDDISDEQLSEYLAGGQWEGKAGAFGYQDRLGWIHIVQGSESNVVGLPLELLAEMLRDMS